MTTLSCPSCGEILVDSKAVPLVPVGGFYNAIWKCIAEDCNIQGVMLSPRSSTGPKEEVDDR